MERRDMTGWIPDVVPDQTIESQWGNTIRNRTVTPFANLAARDVAIPTPVEGMTVWINDLNRIEVYDGAAWRPLAGGEIGYAVNPNSISGIQQTRVSIVTVVATVPPGNRRIRVTGSSMIFKGAGDAAAASVIEIFVDGNAQIARNTSVDSNEQATLTLEWRGNMNGGAHTFELRLYTAASFINAGGNSSIAVDDIGPATVWAVTQQPGAPGAETRPVPDLEPEPKRAEDA
jgi:hypothetical protein